MERIGFGKRLLAAIIDGVIVIVVMAILGTVVGGGIAAAFMGTGATTEGAAVAGVGGGALIGVLLLSVIPVLYSLCEVFLAATPGKMALGLVIRNADGSAATTQVLATRWAVKQSSNLLRFLAALTSMEILGTLATIAGLIIFIGCFFILGANRQGIHDIVAKTAVYLKG